MKLLENKIKLTSSNEHFKLNKTDIKKNDMYRFLITVSNEIIWMFQSMRLKHFKKETLN